MIRLVIGGLALLGLMWFLAWLGRAPPHKRAKAVKLFLLYAAAALLLFLIFSGKLHPLFALVTALLPWIQRALLVRRAFNFFKSARGPTPGQQSTVHSAHLRMTLDHDSGAMDGEITAGTHRGRRLGELDFAALSALLAEYRAADAQSAQLLETYLQREHAADWAAAGEGGGGEGGGAGGAEMAELSVAKAYEVLGLTDSSGREAVVAAHKKLMQKFHPDRDGGSSYLAATINQARDVLLRHLDNSETKP
ncbi:MAG: molecular chaperone DnaJ [Gammaproteobacteria bacterium]|nr:molecular chaperone DnaJ [Gammaproteobacteria bacterium]